MSKLSWTGTPYNGVMSTLNPKLLALLEILTSRDFARIDKIEELSGIDCEELYEMADIKFAETANGIMCFRSNRPGQSGLSNSKIKSLLYYLDAYGKLRVDPINQ